MSRPRHSLDQLLVLDAIIRTGSFSGAAKELHRVPSAITYAVRNLEESLDLSLFEKSGRRSVLTEAGHRVLEQARSVLGEARSLDRLADEIGGEWEPTVRVVADAALPITKIVKGLRHFLDRDLPTRVRLDIECQDGVLERFQQEHADLMLALDFDRELGTFALTHLPTLTMVLVVHPSHPLAQQRQIDKGLLTEELELVVKDSASRFNTKPRGSFMGSEHVIYLPDFHAKRLALLAGVGFGWVPEHVVKDDLSFGRLVEVSLIDGSRWSYHPRLVHRSTEPLGPAGMLLARDLKWAFTGDDPYEG